MKFKKFFLILILLAIFLGMGTMLSNIQSDQADELLEAHGLTNNTRYFRTQNKSSISSFLRYLNKNYAHRQIQLHLDNDYEENQVLVWANHSVRSLPTENGRYFSPDDFEGQVSFAVLGPATKTNELNVQNNKYVILNQQYYSVIGELKNYRQVEVGKYYLSTGIHQPTAKNQLCNYRIVIDGSNNVIKAVARHYHAKLKVPSFVKQHHRDRLTILPYWLGLTGFLLVGIIANAVLALLTRRQAKLTHLHGDLLRNWLINRSMRLFIGEGICSLVAYFFLRWHAFYATYASLMLLLISSWLVLLLSFILTILILLRKDTHLGKSAQ